MHPSHQYSYSFIVCMVRMAAERTITQPPEQRARLPSPRLVAQIENVPKCKTWRQLMSSGIRGHWSTVTSINRARRWGENYARFVAQQMTYKVRFVLRCSLHPGTYFSEPAAFHLDRLRCNHSGRLLVDTCLCCTTWQTRITETCLV